MSNTAPGALETDSYSGIETVVVFAQSGSDQITGGPLNESLFGEVGIDTLIGGGGNDFMFGGDDADIVQGGPGNDFLQGGAANDTLDGGTDADRLFGEAGDDDVVGGDGNDEVDGARGTMISSAVRGTTTSARDSRESRARTHSTGGAGTDTLNGGDGNDGVRGGDGDDSLAVAAGNDTLDGGAGSDWLDATFGSLGDNVQANDTGAGGDDVLSVMNCTGVTVTETTVTKTGSTEQINYTGFEEAPCGYNPPAGAANTLRGELNLDIDYVDPALSFYVPAWQIEYATCAKLLNYPDAGAPEGGRLYPEVAAAMPTVSSDGRTENVAVRSGLPVPAALERAGQSTDFEFALERVLNPAMASPGRTILLSDIAEHRVSPRTAPTLTITLDQSSADDFLPRLTMPFSCPLPTSTPIDLNGIRAPVPSAGPLLRLSGGSTESADRGQGEPELHGSQAAQLRRDPLQDRPTRWRRSSSTSRPGATDFGDVPPAAHAELGRRNTAPAARQRRPVISSTSPTPPRPCFTSR